MSPQEYLEGKGKEYRNMPYLRVYGQKGERCKNCGSIIEKIVIGGRSSCYCPHCQKKDLKVMLNTLDIYNSLNYANGPAVWWSETAYTVMVEAILVQNTSWSSVEKVMQTLPQELTPLYISSLSDVELESLIRPCGFAKRKSATIIRVTNWFRQF